MTCIIAFTILYLSQSLLIQHQESQTYQENLEQKQNQFKQDLSDISFIIKDLKNKLSSENLTKTNKFIMLSESYADERDSLYRTKVNINTPFKLEPCSMYSLTKSSKTDLQNKINRVQESIDILMSKVADCPECSEIQKIKAEIKIQKNYLETIKDHIHSQCLEKPHSLIEENLEEKFDLSDSVFKNNLKAPNWYYGTITEDQYKLFAFSLSTKNNLQTCPIEEPFVDGFSKKCIKCEGWFNLGENHCQRCLHGFLFDHKTLQCIPTHECPLGQAFNKETEQCERIFCEFDQKLNLYTSECQNLCKQGQFFNVNTALCQYPSVDCPKGTKFNLKTINCEKIICQKDKFFSYLKNKCTTFDDIGYGLSIAMCPPERPHWVQSLLECEKCPRYKPYFNKNMNKCE